MIIKKLLYSSGCDFRIASIYPITPDILPEYTIGHFLTIEGIGGFRRVELTLIPMLIAISPITFPF